MMPVFLPLSEECACFSGFFLFIRGPFPLFADNLYLQKDGLYINVLYMKFPSTNKTEFLVYEEFSSVFLTRRGIIVYLEYQSAWPFDGIGPPPPPTSECGSPQDPSGEAHSLAGEGVGYPIVTKGQNSGTLCILYSLYVLTLLSVINDHCIF
jgi:hypothetical protein